MEAVGCNCACSTALIHFLTKKNSFCLRKQRNEITFMLTRRADQFKLGEGVIFAITGCEFVDVGWRYFACKTKTNEVVQALEYSFFILLR